MSQLFFEEETIILFCYLNAIELSNLLLITSC